MVASAEATEVKGLLIHRPRTAIAAAASVGVVAPRLVEVEVDVIKVVGELLGVERVATADYFGVSGRL